MRKKILLIVPMLHQGGFERVCVVTARLLEAYCDVYIAMFDSKDIAYDIKGLNVIDLHIGVKDSLISKGINVMKRASAVKKLKEKLGVDIAYSFGPSANLVNVLSKGTEQIWAGIRSYMDMGNEKKIKMFCKKADKVLCCSEMIEAEIREKYHSDKAVTLYNPLDIDMIKRKAQEEEPRLPFDSSSKIIVTMGREDEVKGYWHLIKSFSLVHAGMPETKLLIVGEGNFEEYRQLAANLRIAEHIYFTGMKKNPFPYLQIASLYVLTSHYEGFPNALLEGMALGLPAIATDCKTGPREILQEGFKPSGKEAKLPAGEVLYSDYGILIPNMEPVKNMQPEVITGEEELLAHEIIHLLEDGKLTNKYSMAASKRAGDFSNRRYVEKIQEFMKG